MTDDRLNRLIEAFEEIVGWEKEAYESREKVRQSLADQAATRRNEQEAKAEELEKSIKVEDERIHLIKEQLERSRVHQNEVQNLLLRQTELLESIVAKLESRFPEGL